MNPFSAFALGFAWLAIVGICLLGWQLLRQNGRLLLRLEELEKRLDTLEFGEHDQPTGLAVGTEAPAFELPDQAGVGKSLAQYRGQPLLPVFFNPDCGFCRDLVPRLAAFSSGSRRGNEADFENHQSAIGNPQSDHRLLTSAATKGLPLLVIITTGDAEKNRELFLEHKLDCPVLLQKDAEVAAAYQTRGTPSGYLISAEGKIASELAMGGEALLKLLEEKAESIVEIDESQRAVVTGNGDGGENRFSQRSLARSKIKRDGLKAGTPAPDFRLPRLDGRGELALSDLRGRPVLLVFSSPGCGPCNAVAPQLEKFHREHPQMEVVMISKGEPKENRAKVKEHGLTFPVVLQQQWEISRRYAMFSTPIAYLIDEMGVIESDVAVGEEAILGLAAGNRTSVTA
jgi:peroxiredoxin